MASFSIAVGCAAILGGLVVGCGGDDSVGIVGGTDGGADGSDDGTTQDSTVGTDSGSGSDTGSGTDTGSGADTGGGTDSGGGDTGAVNDSGGGDTGNVSDSGGGDAPSDAPGDAMCEGGPCPCDAVTGNTYHVDPVNGSDTAGTGSGTAGGVASAACALKTVAKAITLVNAISGGPPTGTKIVVAGPNAVAATEQFPWVVPINTTIHSAGGQVTGNVTANQDGVNLLKPNSGIQGFTLDGQSHTAVHGILIGGTATVNTVLIQQMTLQNFQDAGIRAQGTNANVGATIGPNTHAKTNGTAGAGRPGLRITDSAAILINNPTGDSITFENNIGYGIEVDLQAKLDLTGTPGATIGQGTVVTSGNTVGGFGIYTSPNGSGNPPTTTLTGLVVYNNSLTGGAAFGAAQVKIRSSRFYNNPAGLSVLTSLVGGVANPDDVSGIDLGTNAVSDPGHNVLQSPVNMGQNSSVGLCYAIAPNKSQNLKAFGNTFMATLATVSAQYDCSAVGSTGAQLTKPVSNSCLAGGGTSYSGNGTNGNVLSVGVCIP
jgi:hypothetical protein